MGTRKTKSAKRKARTPTRKKAATPGGKASKTASSAAAPAAKSAERKRTSKATKSTKTTRTPSAGTAAPAACRGLRSLRERIESIGKQESKPATTARQRNALIKALEGLEAEYARLQGPG